DRPIGLPRAVPLDALAPPHPEGFLPGRVAHETLDEGRLPDPRLSRDERDLPQPRERRAQTGLQLPQLFDAAEQGRRGRARILPSRTKRGDESVPAPGQRLDEPRLLGGIAEHLAEPLDRRVEAVLEVDVDVARPELRPQGVPRYQLAWTVDEDGEKAED